MLSFYIKLCQFNVIRLVNWLVSFCRLFAVGVVIGLLALDEKGTVEQRFV